MKRKIELYWNAYCRMDNLIYLLKQNTLKETLIQEFTSEEVEVMEGIVKEENLKRLSYTN